MCRYSMSVINLLLLASNRIIFPPAGMQCHAEQKQVLVDLHSVVGVPADGRLLSAVQYVVV